jgi:hypothetical protein
MMDVTPLIYAGIAGSAGGLAYSYYNRLMTVATYLVAIEHIAAGFVVGAIAVTGLGYAVPTGWQDAFPIAALGYAGTDVLDSLAAKLKASAPAPPAAPVPPP